MTTYAQICVARLLKGLGIGAASGLVPVFQAKAAPTRWRSLVTGYFQFYVTLGIWGVSMANCGMSSYVGDIRYRYHGKSLNGRGGGEFCSIIV